MKILFTCSSIEPGRDGVGDYTRRLAFELIKLGHAIAILALNDRHIRSVSEGQLEIEELKQIRTLRISPNISSKDKIKVSERFISNFNPDYLSLQFVSYGFNVKGLPFTLGKYLKRISQGRTWHIMFHELWIGIEDGANLKHKIYGAIQRYIILNLIKSLNPKVIHSQTHLYLYLLKDAGLTAKYLSLFGNIPQTAFNQQRPNTSHEISIAIFGGIHVNAPIQNLTFALKTRTRDTGLPFKLNFIGRNGSEIKKWLMHCQESGIETEVLGELNETEISNVLSRCDIGIATTPMLLIEKSGSVAAMREHGLPILCVAKPWKVKNYHQTTEWTDIFDFERSSISIFEELARIKTSTSSLPSVAAQFLKDLNNN